MLESPESFDFEVRVGGLALRLLRVQEPVLLFLLRVLGFRVLYKEIIILKK